LSPLSAFEWGCVGSAALEVVLFCHAVRSSRRCRVPARYKKPAFIIGRMLLTLVAGAVAVAWGITHAMQGLAIGVATPRLILSLENLRLPALTKGDSDPNQS